MMKTNYVHSDYGKNQALRTHMATQSTVSAIISGKRKITLDQVKGFAKFFNVPESMFLG